MVSVVVCCMESGDGLCAQQLEALVKMVPTKEEEDKLSNYQGDMDELGSAEKFVKAMLNIPFAFQRIEAMLYRDTFEDEVVHLRKSFAMLEVMMTYNICLLLCSAKHHHHQQNLIPSI